MKYLVKKSFQRFETLYEISNITFHFKRFVSCARRHVYDTIYENSFNAAKRGENKGGKYNG